MGVVILISPDVAGEDLEDNKSPSLFGLYILNESITKEHRPSLFIQV